MHAIVCIILGDLETDTLDLSALTSLQSVRFNLTTTLATLPATDESYFLISLRALVTLPPIAFELIYKIYFDYPHDFEEDIPTSLIGLVDWAFVEASILALPQPPTNLRIVVLSHSRHKDSPAMITVTQIEDAIRPRLPGLSGRGSLSVQLDRHL